MESLDLPADPREALLISCRRGLATAGVHGQPMMDVFVALPQD